MQVVRVPRIGANGAQIRLIPVRLSFWRRRSSNTKQLTHQAGSLPDLVFSLVKTWEIEASSKTSLGDWRTIDHNKYTFSLNGGPPQTGDHMLRVGTYNALLTSSSYYDPEHNDFSTSHMVFKRMMPTFAWEVLEWRRKGHYGLIDIQGIVIARVNSSLQLKIDVWVDPMNMFRQIAREETVEGETKGPVEAGSMSRPRPWDRLERASCPMGGNERMDQSLDKHRDTMI
ncbi:hypothetical protein CFD26_104590 [Aspergillus turcosus]|uniref:Uncharacterized protein n=1 Tax=Aspergillus turcosus TaxID=1245748 RepID=A0A421D1H5_9EURO|nr:hypothetical protein CFD26_104590 [Aspergillus turcosus]